MSSIILNGDTSGAITLAAPSVAGANTATLPAAAGTVMVSGNMPAFSAYLSANTGALTAATWTKITCDTKEFDTNSNYSSGRFTPTVAGYYQVSGAASPLAFAGNYFLAAIYKNGSLYKNGSNYPTSALAGPTSNFSALVYLNGSTDYVEMYAIANGTPSILSGVNSTYFQAVLVRTS